MVMRPVVIAEIGCNHKGEIEIAKEMIRIARNHCNVDVVKFQKREPKFLLTEEEYHAPHPVPENSYGDTYGAHREYLEFSLDENIELKRYCEEIGIVYSTSVWDSKSARDIVSLNPSLIKVPSACNLNREILEILLKDYSGEIHISLGMSTIDEIVKIYNFVKERERLKDVVFYSCTSGYPVESNDVCLMEITRLKDMFGSEIKGVGFSGHHLGTAIDISAFTLGATYIERHFTLNRAWKGTDHAASLEPDCLRRLVMDLEAVASAMKYKPKEILDVELTQRAKLKENQIKW